MSLTQAQIDSLNKREGARWEKACTAVTEAEDRIAEIKDDIASKKKELDKFNEATQKAKATRKKVAEELKEISRERASKRSPTKAKAIND